MVGSVSHLGILYSSRGVVVVKVSFISLYFKCFIAKDSDVSSLTISADWGKASGTYEICILFTNVASIERPLHLVDAGDDIMVLLSSSFVRMIGYHSMHCRVASSRLELLDSLSGHNNQLALYCICSTCNKKAIW